MTRQEKKYEVKLAILQALAEAGEGPDVLVKQADPYATVKEVGGDAASAAGTALKYMVLPLTVGIPSLLAYNTQRLRNTAKADMRAALDVETIAAYRRAAAEAEEARKARKRVVSLAAAPQQEAAGLPW